MNIIGMVNRSGTNEHLLHVSALRNVQVESLGSGRLQEGEERHKQTQQRAVAGDGTHQEQQEQGTKQEGRQEKR